MTFLQKASDLIHDQRDTLITLFLRVLGVVTLFGFTMFFTNNYSAMIVGEYEFVRIVLLVLGGICLLGTDISILYFAGRLKSKDSLGSLYTLYFKIISLIVGLSFLFLFIYLTIPKAIINSFFGKENSYNLIYQCLLFLSFNVITLFNTEMLRALGNIVWSELFRNTIKFFPVFIGSIYLLGDPHEYLILDFYIKGFFILAVVTSIYTCFLLTKIKHLPKTDHISLRQILHISFPIAVSSIIMYLLMTIDLVLIRKEFGSASAGYYTLAIKLMTILSMVILSVNVNVSPKIADLYLRNEFVELQALLQKSAKVIFVLNILSATFILLFSSYILRAFGQEYIEAKYALYILVVGQVLCSFFGSTSVYLNMTERPTVFRFILLIALGINIISNLILIGKLGILGAAISFILSALFWNIASASYIYKKDGVKIFIH